MISALRTATLGLVLVVLPLAAAQAGPARPKAASAGERAAQAAAEKFSLRMSRLDALMGGASHRAGALPRSRSANAEH